MKAKLVLTTLLLVLVGFIAKAENNDFYDNTPTTALTGPLTLEVGGEVAAPGKIDLASLPLRSVIVREAAPEGKGSRFVGAYRYDGHSLFDILKEYEVKKKSAGLSSVIDLYVVVENAKGEKAVLSWGEIYYPVAHHRVLIATKAAPIIPTKTGEQWPLPKETRLVCADDLLTVRGVTNPSKITVVSAAFDAPDGPRPAKLTSPEIRLAGGTGKDAVIAGLPAGAERRVYPTVFYGRGKGFHGTEDFDGVLLKDVLKPHFPSDPKALTRGWFLVAAPDGYRIVVTAAELFNRNDCREFLIIDRGKDADGGRFSLFPACDYFSDRAVKAVREIRYQAVE
ncbi:MAG: hypothetical protein KA419_16335 [Acidobacteria bacterium]|nr:hypothetical protein [Acidobacteriota bacterium]